MQLSEHFNSIEFDCRCGCGGLSNGAGVDPKLVALLERMRKACGKPLVLSCGYRCPRHNADVGGVPNSQHVYGTAADVQTPKGMTPFELFAIADDCGADGIGLYSWGVHVDVRGEKARW